MTILEALKSREWVYSSFYGSRFCITCNRGEYHGHAPDCEYAAAIREAERMEYGEKCPYCGPDGTQYSASGDGRICSHCSGSGFSPTGAKGME